MGLLDFLKDAGPDLFKGKEDRQAEAILEAITKALGSNVSGLGVTFDDGKVTLKGQANSVAAKEKAALIAGNVRGVSSVNDDALTVPAAAAPTAGATAGAPAAAAKATRYYTIKSGDSLSKIAKEVYGDANAYDKIFEANREVIVDPDKIYPGQQIRIPAA
jgi:nucleoid-associated protein YgaU